MANIVSVDVKEGRFSLSLEVSRDEYASLGSATQDILLVPLGSFSESLTSGTLGHSNRIMLPTKVMRKHGIDVLPKKVPAGVSELLGSKFLVLKLVDRQVGVPSFK